MLPKVRLVTLNYDGGEMTMECLTSLLNLDYPTELLEIVMVDNASVDGIVDKVRASMPRVRVIEAFANLGFSGGCNLGMQASGEWDYVGLINNDATVEPNWLHAMLKPFGSGKGVGASCSKMLFAQTFYGVTIDAPIAEIKGRYRTKRFGVRVSGARIGDQEMHDVDVRWSRAFSPQLDRTPTEPFARWTTALSEFHAVATAATSPSTTGTSQPLQLRLSATTPINATISTPTASLVASLTTEPTWFTIDPAATTYDVIQNAGSGLFKSGFGGDRGFLHRDAGQHDQPAEVFAWCGGAVLLSKPYLDDVGYFDENLFLYYEDTDLAWRGRLKEWMYVYEPSAVVRHRHAASTVAGSSLFRYQVDRNRLLTLAKNAPLRLIHDAIMLEIGQSIANVVFDVLYPLRHGRRPRLGNLHHRLVVAKGVLRWLPAALRERATSTERKRRAVAKRWLGVDA